MTLSVKLGERHYEFDDMENLSKARAIYMDGTHTTQEEFKELLDKAEVKFTIDLFSI